MIRFNRRAYGPKSVCTVVSAETRNAICVSRWQRCARTRRELERDFTSSDDCLRASSSPSERFAWCIGASARASSRYGSSDKSYLLKYAAASPLVFHSTPFQGYASQKKILSLWRSELAFCISAPSVQVTDCSWRKRVERCSDRIAKPPLPHVRVSGAVLIVLFSWPSCGAGAAAVNRCALHGFRSLNS